MTPRASWSWWSAAPFALACAALAVPGLFLHWPVLALALQRGFALVCHQQSERSFSLFGGSVAVCARCLGIYLGAAAGLAVRVPRHLAWRWLLAAAALNLADCCAELAGWHGNWLAVRGVLGGVLGMSVAMLVTNSQLGAGRGHFEETGAPGC